MYLRNRPIGFGRWSGCNLMYSCCTWFWNNSDVHKYEEKSRLGKKKELRMVISWVYSDGSHAWKLFYTACYKQRTKRCFELYLSVFIGGLNFESSSSVDQMNFDSGKKHILHPSVDWEKRNTVNSSFALYLIIFYHFIFAFEEKMLGKWGPSSL